MAYTEFPLNINPMVLLTEKKNIIQLVNAVEKTTINWKDL